MPFQRDRFLAATLIALFGFVAAANAQPSYRIVDVGPSNQAGFCSNGRVPINTVGQAVAINQNDGPGTIRSYLVDTAGLRRDIGTLEGGNTWATTIDDNAVIIGNSFFLFGSVATTHAFIWTERDGIRDLTPASSGSQACGMNAAGDIVGFTDLHAFIYTGGVLYDLNDLNIEGREAFSVLEVAGSINNSGQIFGVGQVGSARHGFILTPTSGATTNLVVDGGFEGTTPPSLAPGWVSDDSLRQTPAFAETNQPRTGAKNAACWTPQNLDCGMYQEVVAPETGTYLLTMYANADRPGGLVGFNINGGTVGNSLVEVNGFGVYRAYSATFPANKGNTIRVWMYSPPTPGYVVIDDVSLVLKPPTATSQR